MKTLTELQPLIIEWAKEKDLLKKENAYKQAEKTQEELDEMKIHIYMQKNGIEIYFKNGIEVNVNEAIKDDIGDQLVTLAIQCEQQGTNFEECLNIAWNEIKDRKGKTVEGTFIKN